PRRPDGVRAAGARRWGRIVGRHRLAEKGGRVRAPGHRGPWRRRERRQARVVLVAAAMVAMALATISAPTAAGPPAGNEWLEGRRILNLAHGGGLKEAPEGTLFAYKTAAERGAT